ncbi:MAG: HAD family phosphatase [Sphingobacteriia bacterium]|nr:HAD family phosphatase [Sphingobacteriia bacterium]
MTQIKNILFDFGNILFLWNPKNFIKEYFFDDPRGMDLHFSDKGSELWRGYNRGIITFKELIDSYNEITGINKTKLKIYIKEFLPKKIAPLDGAFELINQLKDNNYKLYGLTDNFPNFIEYFYKNYKDISSKFSDIIISYNAKSLKPEKVIYQYLLTTNNIIPEETIFFDDIEKNISTAKEFGINAYQANGPKEVKDILLKLNLIK